MLRLVRVRVLRQEPHLDATSLSFAASIMTSFCNTHRRNQKERRAIRLIKMRCKRASTDFLIMCGDQDTNKASSKRTALWALQELT